MEVRRVKLLLTVPDRCGSFTSAGLVGVDMAKWRGNRITKWVLIQQNDNILEARNWERCSVAQE
jgi:hypothetical protein